MQQIYLPLLGSRYTRFMKQLEITKHPERETIEKRVKILSFFDTYGAAATKEAFGTSRSTVFGWKKLLRDANGKLLSLAPGSRAPKNKRTRETHIAIVQYIANYRRDHPGVSKETIKPELDEYCREVGLAVISESTIGRVIADLKKAGKLPKSNKIGLSGSTGKLLEKQVRKTAKKDRVGSYKPDSPGDLVQIDALVFFVFGVRRYILTGIDLKTRFAFAYGYKTLSSSTAKDFLKKFQAVAPFEIRRIQTDNGSEFHKYFRIYAKECELVHYYNYPRCPKMNAFIERFNRTIQDQYVSWHIADLLDPATFNRGLMEYLIWYNTKKQHKGLGKVPPLRYYLDTFVSSQKSNMYWTLTQSGQKRLNLLYY